MTESRKSPSRSRVPDASYAAAVLRERWEVHGLHATRPPGDAATPLVDAAVLDLGVQDTGADAGAWALTNRGAPVARGAEDDAGLALAWTVRGAPHLYRRSDLSVVARAVAPYDADDAASRIYDASKPLKAAGLDILDALRTVAAEMRDIVTEPMDKGSVSTALSARLPEPFLRFCAGCDAVHVFEMPFRLAALQAGLELVPGTSPPVLRPVAGWEVAPFSPVLDPAPGSAEARLDVVAAFRRFFPHAGPQHAAAYLDAPRAVVARRWESVGLGSADSVSELSREQTKGPSSVRLLGPFDPFLQLKDREILAPDAALRKAIWPTLGRPGVVLQDGQVLALWRPRARGRRFAVLLDEVVPLAAPVRALVEEEAERLALHRGSAWDGFTTR